MNELARLLTTAAMSVVFLVAPATADHHASASADAAVVASIETPTSEVVLGETLTATVEVVNRSADATGRLAVHIDIIDPSSESSVDPEDWTPTLTRSISALGPGDSTRLNWQLQPISPGEFSVYAVVIDPAAGSIAVSNLAAVAVADHRSLNPGGVLPVAIAVPTALGAVLAYQTRRRRRTAI